MKAQTNWNAYQEMAKRQLAERPPPCVHPVKCPYCDVCAKYELACEAFAAYCAYESKKKQVCQIPNHEWFDRVYGEVDA